MNRLFLVEAVSGTRHEVRPDDVIGRSGCEVVIDDAEISRNHARIRSLSSGPAIEDLGSTNGTSLNGHKLTGAETIRDGDELKLGDTVLRVAIEAVGAATQATPPPAPDPTPAPQPPVRVPEPEPPAPEPPAPEPPAPVPAPQVAAPQAADGSRGDVPAPQPASASRVHAQPFAPPAAGEAPPFQPAGGAGGSRASAATRVEATVAAYAITLLTAIGVIAFLAGR